MRDFPLGGMAMIVEMRITEVKVGTVPLVEERFAKALPDRLRLSRLGAFWRTEVGTLNQIVEIWPYESLAERDRVQREAAGWEGWPADVQEFIVEQTTEILTPAPFSPPIEARRLGDLYEIRTYGCRPGAIPGMIDRWSEKIEARVRLSPLVGCWYTTLGTMNKWVHVWAYPNAAERQRIRQEAVRLGVWPPNTQALLVKQQNALAVPAPFSPLA